MDSVGGASGSGSGPPASAWRVRELGPGLCLGLALKRRLAVPRGSPAAAAFPPPPGAPESPAEALAADLGAVLGGGGDPSASFADVAFLVEGQEVFAHRVLLAARSRAFREGFRAPGAGGWEPRGTAAADGGAGVPLYEAEAGVRVDAFRAALRHVYSGALHFPVPEVYLETVPKAGGDSLDAEAEREAALTDRELRFLTDVLHVATAYGLLGLRRGLLRQLAEFAFAPAWTVLVAGIAQAFEARELLEFCLHTLARANPFEMEQSVQAAPPEFGELVWAKRAALGLPSRELLELQRAVYARDWDRVGTLVRAGGGTGGRGNSVSGGGGLSLDEAHALHHIAAHGSAAEVELVAGLRGCSVNHQDREGRTPLHHAMVAGNSGAVKALLGLGANPHVRDDAGRDPLEALEDHRADLIAQREAGGAAAAPVDEERELQWAESYMATSEHASKVLEPVRQTRSRSSQEDHLWLDHAALTELAAANDERGWADILCLQADPAGGLFPAAGAAAHGELISHCLPQTCLALLELERAGGRKSSVGEDAERRAVDLLARALAEDFSEVGGGGDGQNDSGFQPAAATGFDPAARY